MRIELITPEVLASQAAEFAGLLRDAVEQGASIGFTLPLTEAELTDYWRKVGAEVASDPDGRLVPNAIFYKKLT